MSSSFETPRTAANQAALSMGFPRQEYWSGSPFSSPGDLPNPGIKPGSSALQADIGDLGSIPELGRFTEEGNGNPLQYSCLGNPMDKEIWQSTVCGVAKSWTCLSD